MSILYSSMWHVWVCSCVLLVGVLQTDAQVGTGIEFELLVFDYDVNFVPSLFDPSTEEFVKAAHVVHTKLQDVFLGDFKAESLIVKRFHKTGEYAPLTGHAQSFVTVHASIGSRDLFQAPRTEQAPHVYSSVLLELNAPVTQSALTKHLSGTLLDRQQVLMINEGWPTEYIGKSFLTTGDCLNGGILSENGQCVCAPFYHGQQCEFIECVHGGYPDVDHSFCYCPPGFIGSHCEPGYTLIILVVANTAPGRRTFEVDSRALTLVVNNKAALGDLIASELFTAADEIIKYYNQSVPSSVNTTFDWYVLAYGTTDISMTHDVSLTTVIATNESATFQRKVQQMPFVKTGNPLCEQDTLSFLYQAVSGQATLKPNSPIILVTDSLSRKEDYTQGENRVRAQLIGWQHNVYPVLVQSQDCAASLVPTVDGYKVYNRLAQQASGHVITVAKNDLTNALVFLANSTFSRANVLSLDDQALCKWDGVKTESIIVEANVTEIVVTATGSKVVLTISGAAVPPVYNLNNLYIFLVPVVESPSSSTVSLTLKADATAACSMRVRSAGQVQAWLAHTQDKTIDAVTPWQIMGPPSLMVVGTYKYPPTTSIDATVFISSPVFGTAGAFFAKGYVRNKFSQFQALFSPWSCVNKNQPYYVKLVGARAPLFQRTVVTYCDHGGADQPPPTDCANGGTLTAQGSCMCTDYFTGTRCEQPICMNGAKLNETLQCKCEIGFSGLHCENAACTASTPSPAKKTRSLSFVISNGRQMSDTLAAIKTAADQLQQIPELATYFNEFILTTFVRPSPDGSPIYTQNTFTTWQDFVDAVGKITHETMDLQNCGPLQPLFTATQTTLAKVTNPWSPTFVFTDLAAGDPSRAYATMIATKDKYSQVNFVLVDDVVAAEGTKCNVTGTNPITKDGHNKIHDLAYATGGMVLYFKGTDPKADITSAIVQLVQHQPQMQLVTAADNSKCAMRPKTQIFHAQATDVLVQVTSTEDLTLPVSVTLKTLSDGTSVALTSVQYGNYHQFSGTLPAAGGYELTVADASQFHCSNRVRVKSEILGYVAFTQIATIDKQDTTPHFGEQSLLAVLLNDESTSSGQGLTMVSGSVLLNVENQTALETPITHIDNRTVCTFSTYSTDRFACFGAAKPIYVKLLVKTAETGAAVEDRLVPTFCHVQDKCLNGGHNLADGTCDCTGTLFLGDKCETPKCLNGSTIDDATNTCTCADQSGGAHCDQFACAQKVPPPASIDFQSMTFVIDTQYSMLVDINAFKAQARQIVNSAFNQSPTWISKWTILLMYKDYTRLMETTTDPDKFIELVGRVEPVYVETTQCESPIFTALEQAIDLSSDNGLIFVLADKVASDADVASHSANVTQAIEVKRVQITVVQSTHRPCGLGVNDPKVKVLRDMVARTDGRVIVTYKQYVGDLISKFIPVTYGGQAVVSVNSIEGGCDTEQSLTFTVGTFATSIVASVYGILPSATLTTPEGALANPTIILDNTAGFAFVMQQSLTDMPRGTWTLKVKTSPDPYYTLPCGAQVFVQSLKPIKVGYTNDQHSDVVFSRPRANETMNYMLVDSFPTIELTRLLLLHANNSQYGNYTMHARADCSFNYISDAFLCHRTDGAPTQFNVELIGIDNTQQTAPIPYKRRFREFCGELVCGEHTTGTGPNGCECAPNWTGIECREGVCQNGGTLVGEACACPFGTNGPNCENIVP